MNVIDLLIKLLSYKSTTPNDDGALSWIESYLSDYEVIYHHKEGVKNIFLTKQFGKSDVHLCFAGHIDVVPPGDGWSSNPFVPVVDNGNIYGRGAQDMKSGVAAFVQAAKDTKEFHGRLSLLLTSDEEGEAVYGTNEMLKYLQNINMLPTHCIVAEPTCEEQFGDAIKVGRRGSINGILYLRGKQGHAAYPEKSDNPIHTIAPILPSLVGVHLDDGDEYFAPSTLVITDIRSGMEVTNVTPGILKMMFNVRNSTQTTIDDIRLFVEQKFDGLDFSLELSQSANPFVTSSQSMLAKTVTASIEKYCHIAPKYSTAGGTSDARYIAPYGIEVLEFGVINDTIHAPNERVGIDEVEKLYKVFMQVIKDFPIKG
ncbi:MAG: succinyl-diaminopimelate desuccinylase [Sulfurovaceae bacterium]|nr:succinyl-diaminopimelate desuccinylase [Sulfurovaceae bacterium]